MPGFHAVELGVAPDSKAKGDQVTAYYAELSDDPGPTPPYEEAGLSRRIVMQRLITELREVLEIRQSS